MSLVRLILTAFLLAGCVSTNAVMLGELQNFPPVPPPAVRVYQTPTDVPGDFIKIALINASGASGLTNEPQMIEAAQKKAGELGANAIVLGEIIEPSAGAKVAGAVFGVSTERKGRVTAIRVPRLDSIPPEYGMIITDEDDEGVRKTRNEMDGNIGKVRRGERFQIIGRHERWTAILLPDGKWGWIETRKVGPAK